MPCMHLLVKTIRVWPRDVFDWVLGLQTFFGTDYSQDENKDGNRTIRANCRRPRWFVVYGALSAGVAFVSGLISLQP